MAERRAKLTRNPVMLKDVLDMLGYRRVRTSQPIMAEAKVFGSVKRKADVPIGAEE